MGCKPNKEKKVGRANNKDLYFNKTPDEDLLKSLDDCYFEYIDAKPKLFRKSAEKSIEKYWGTPSENEAYRNPNFKLGVRGQLWAMCCLRMLVFSNASVISLQEFSNAIIDLCLSKKGEEKKEIVKAAEKEEGSDFCDNLKDLISSVQKERCPSLERAELLVHLIVAYISKEIEGELVPERFQRLLDGESYKTPSQLYKIFCKEFGFDLEGKAAAKTSMLGHADVSLLSKIDSKLDYELIDKMPVDNGPTKYITADISDRTHPVVCQLGDKLAAAGGSKPRLIILHGEPFAGKKPILSRLLRVIYQRANGKMQFEIEDFVRAPIACLPILAVSAKGLHYKQLVGKVTEFLLRCNEFTGTPITNNSNLMSSGFDFEECLKGVSNLHTRFPGFFVFADVDVFISGNARNAVRDIGIRRLIATIMESNPRSIVLLTTTATLDKAMQDYLLAVLPHYGVVKVDPPKVSNIFKFVDDELCESILSEISGILDVEICGDILATTATLFNISKKVRDEHIKALHDLCSEKLGNRFQQRSAIFKYLIQEIQKQGLLHTIALIAVSEDGIRDDTLYFALKKWCKSNSDVETFKSINDLEKRLEIFKELTGRVFLKRSPIVREDVEEYGYEERFKKGEKVWEFEASIASALLDAICEERSEVALTANRLIAIVARERAEYKKIFMRAPIAFRASDESYRDIQSYICLLASFSKGDLSNNDENINIKPLRLMEDAVFTLDKNKFNARIAFRYAFLCLLKGDIDRDKRLSMVSDEDALRLDLYLLLFQNPGQRYGAVPKELTFPATLPEHLKGDILSIYEIIDLMTTISLSAFHAQRPGIVIAVSNLADKLANTRKEPNITSAMARIWCSWIDVHILKGGEPRKTGYVDIISYIHGLIERYFSGVDHIFSNPEESSKKEIENNRPEIEARMMLVVREAEIAALIHKDRTIPQEIYNIVERLEYKIAKEFGRYDPIVLSGRTARRYIRFLFRDPIFRSGAIGDIAAEEKELRARNIDTGNRLIDVNIARLKRFSGGDRVGVMLDLARFKFTENKIEVALRYADQAYIRAFSGTVSLGTKLDVLAVAADLHILRVQEILSSKEPLDAGRVENRDYLKTANMLVRDLKAICISMQYKPYLGIANYLLSKVGFVQYQLWETLNTPELSTGDDPLEKALQYINSAIDILEKVGDITFYDDMRRLRGEIQSAKKNRLRR